MFTSVVHSLCYTACKSDKLEPEPRTGSAFKKNTTQPIVIVDWRINPFLQKVGELLTHSYIRLENC